MSSCVPLICPSLTCIFSLLEGGKVEVGTGICTPHIYINVILVSLVVLLVEV